MNAKQFLENHLNQRGSQTALIDSMGQLVSWSQFGEWVETKATELATEDRSKPTIYRSTNSIDDVVLAIAVACVGGIEAPLDARLCKAEFDRRKQKLEQSSEPDHGCSNGGFDSDLGGVVLWTSGTTSQPMAVMQSQESWLGNALAKLKAVPQSSDDIRLTVLPLSHAYARTCDLGTWLISGCTLAVELGMDGLVRSAPSVSPTVMNVVPSLAYDLLKRKVPGLDRLRLLGVGGAALSGEAFAAWKHRGVTVIQGYGLTETGPVIASATPENATTGLVGSFVDGWQHKLCDGVLWVRGPSLLQGYWQDRDATARRVTRDGWLNTHDRVEIDSQTGQLRILGRDDDVIVLDNGIKIHPSMIERTAEQVAGVQHAMLVLRNQLELWIDGQSVAEQSVRSILLPHPWGRDTQIRFFDHPLSIEAGELTSKLTIRRAKIRNSLSRYAKG